MKKTTNEPPSPAPYSNTDSAEARALHVFRGAVDVELAKLDLRQGDKMPNIDGYIEMVDLTRIPFGKLEVQVRKIPDGKMSYQCPGELFAYSACTANPLILVCVDVGNSRCFWRHIKLSDYPSTNQASLVLHFASGEAISNTDKSYIAEWGRLAREYAQRAHNLTVAGTVAATSSVAAPTSPDILKPIQSYLDELNLLLDRDFRCVKRRYFPGVWKLGFGLQSWSTDQISYLVYPIYEGQGTHLIRGIDPSVDLRSLLGESVFAAYGRNTLLSDPKLAARKYVLDCFEGLLRRRLLSARVERLAVEVLFDYIENHAECLGLERKDEYTTQEIWEGFHEFLPRWCQLVLGVSDAEIENYIVEPTQYKYRSTAALVAEVRRLISTGNAPPQVKSLSINPSSSESDDSANEVN